MHYRRDKLTVMKYACTVLGAAVVAKDSCRVRPEIELLIDLFLKADWPVTAVQTLVQ